ncbi:hypothetical protein RYX36_033735, partial [Vicia faba]
MSDFLEQGRFLLCLFRRDDWKAMKVLALKGNKVGTSEILAILPSFPDNGKVNEDDDFWVAIHCR